MSMSCGISLDEKEWWEEPTHWWLQAAIWCHNSFLNLTLKSALNHVMLVIPKSLVAFAKFVSLSMTIAQHFSWWTFQFYKYFFNKIYSAGKNQGLLATK